MKAAIGCDPNAAGLKREVIEAVVRGKYERGVVLCATGIGASIAANKVPGAYCALVTDPYQATSWYSAVSD
jgi:ribose 5-phosphate isomerase B